MNFIIAFEDLGDTDDNFNRIRGPVYWQVGLERTILDEKQLSYPDSITNMIGWAQGSLDRRTNLW